MTRVPLLTVLIALALAPHLHAQVEGSPHGPLPEGLTCVACHTTEAWSPLRTELDFDHASDAGFPLDGKHEDIACSACHEGARFGAVEEEAGDCASCHLDVHQGTLARPCASCHTTTSFSEMSPGVVHPADFPLVGAHLQTSCESCHQIDVGGAFAPLDQECTSCHMGDYFAAPLVDHRALGFSTNCVECHSFLDFRDVAFDHFAISAGFPLRGRHAGIECISCHLGPGGAVPFTPAGAEDCVSCHLTDYQEEHGGSGFPTTCTMCHDVDGWEGGDFDHLAVSGFELLPNHDRLLCAECHVGSTSETIFQPSGPQDCHACHQSDYDREHAGTGFPTNCVGCHRGTTWGGATFDHAFPITSGAHGGTDCADCHTVLRDYDSFSCLGCHEHRQSAMDEKHRERSGYVYDSQACLSCHPNGRS